MFGSEVIIVLNTARFLGIVRESLQHQMYKVMQCMYSVRRGLSTNKNTIKYQTIRIYVNCSATVYLTSSLIYKY